MKKNRTLKSIKLNNTKNTYDYTLDNRSEVISKIQIVPLVLLIVIVPLIVRLKIMLLSVDVAKFWDGPVQADFYSYNKAMTIIFISVLIIILMLLTLRKKDFEVLRQFKAAVVALIAFSVFTIVSTLLSKNISVALWGAPERYEGMIVQLCYVLILVYTLITLRTENSIKYIKYAFLLLAGIMSVIGISQIIGRDILDSDLVYSIMVPTEYKGMIGERIKSTEIYLTLQNPNYVASYAALIIPFLTAISLDKTENKNIRVITMIFSVVTLAILLFSRVQSGLVALVGVAPIALWIFRTKLFSRKKLVLSVALITIASIASINVYMEGFVLKNLEKTANEAVELFRPSQTKFDPTYGFPIPSIKFEGHNIVLETIGGEIEINVDENYNLTFFDEKGNVIHHVNKQNRYSLSEPYSEIFIDYLPETEMTKGFDENSKPINIKYSPILIIYYDGKQRYIVHLDTENGYNLIDSQYNLMEPVMALHVGFEGKEKLGSGRGYIWSRTIPMIKETVIFGNGPDTFLMSFPQNDLFAKSFSYHNPNTITDKPHNMYLQLAVNNGLIALLSLAYLWIMYAYDSLKLYFVGKGYESLDYFSIACFLGFTGHMIAGFFNDSLVGVAPLYWIMLGCGLAVNKMCKDRNIKNEKQVI